MKDYLLIIGIMTGNSLDGADVVLTKFYKDGKIEDIASFSLPAPSEQYTQLKQLRSFINDHQGNMELVANTYPNFGQILDSYTCFVADAVHGLLDKAHTSASEVDLIGFHGQTCAHFPPSQAKGARPYTVQLGDGQKLAKLTGINVAFDFRSDDLLAGGEGAPLAPMHNKHIAQSLGFPITFINGGNTSNVAHISGDEVMGWDAGPFNHFPDLIARKYFNQTCDHDGNIGRIGKIHEPLLAQLFSHAAIMASGGNFLDIPPPKSSDPQWYKTVPLLDDDTISAADKMRTAEYFSAYLTFHTLGHTPKDFSLPSKFAVFGGGWRNPIVMADFMDLLNGRPPVTLPEHTEIFDHIRSRIGSSPEVKLSHEYGFDGTMMEARIFADLARCLIVGKAFTTPQTTGVQKPVICGVIAYADIVTQNLKDWMGAYGTQPLVSAAKWSRASIPSRQYTKTFIAHLEP